MDHIKSICSHPPATHLATIMSSVSRTILAPGWERVTCLKLDRIYTETAAVCTGLDIPMNGSTLPRLHVSVGPGPRPEYQTCKTSRSTPATTFDHTNTAVTDNIN